MGGGVTLGIQIFLGFHCCLSEKKWENNLFHLENLYICFFFFDFLGFFGLFFKVSGSRRFRELKNATQIQILCLYGAWRPIKVSESGQKFGQNVKGGQKFGAP